MVFFLYKLLTLYLKFNVYNLQEIFISILFSILYFYLKYCFYFDNRIYNINPTLGIRWLKKIMTEIKKLYIFLDKV
jgi:hypothetical protein